MAGTATKSLILALGLMALSGTVMASPMPDNSHLGSPLRYPGAPKPVYDDGPAPPYALNYIDEVAQDLGIKDGHMDVFSSHPAADDPLMPMVSGGLGGDGAMLRLQWRQGF